MTDMPKDEKTTHTDRTAELLPQIVFECDVTGRLTFVNKRAFAIFGYTEEEFDKGLNVFSMILAEDHGRAADNMQKVLTGQQPYGNEYRAVKKDGTVFPVMIYSSVIEEKGSPAGLRGIIIDMTDIRRAEDERIINESKFRAIYDQTANPVGIIDTDGILLEANRAAKNALGENPAEYIGKPFWLTPWWDHSPDTRDILESKIKQALKGDFIRFEIPYLNRRKQTRALECTIKPVLDPDKKVFCLILEGMDITEKKQAEHVMRLVEYGVNHSRDSIFWLDTETRFVYVNEAACRSLGYTRKELLSMKVSDIDPNFPLEAWGPHIEKLRQYGSITHESCHRTKDGGIIPVEITGNYVFFEGMEGSFAFVRDISDRKQADAERARLQEQLVQAQKMESVGRLAGGVAHDFNNMLGVISGRAELALTRVAADHPVHSDLTQILNAASRSADITRKLLAFARKQTIEPKVLDLNTTVESMLSMLRRLIGEDITLSWLPAQGLWLVRMDPSQIDQILANLCVNARDAISGVGKLVIETGMKRLDAADCADHPDMFPGDYVVLAVSDDGCGMDREVQEKLFEPFFTTKEKSKGTGLGLATVYGIVKQNNGFLTVYSEPGRGSVFRIYLPRCRASDEAPAAVNSPKPVPGGHETILLVEDDPAILEMTRMMLEHRGYRVLSAATPLDAVDLAKGYPAPLDLLITDVVMPEMNGRVLAEKITELCPDIRRLFMSGYTADVIASQGVLDNGVAFIQKPFSMKDLAEKVREVLDKSAGTPGDC
jgi:PAS domain S-box-containing protein